MVGLFEKDGKFVDNDIPGDFVVDNAVSVDELVAKRNDPTPLSDPLRRFGIEFVKLAQGFTDDQKVPLDGVPKFTIGEVMIP